MLTEPVAVQVRLFAQLRDQLGIGSMALRLEPPANLDALIKAMVAGLAPTVEAEAALALLTASNVRIAVNQSLVDGECRLADGDEVAFLPPVTGG